MHSGKSSLDVLFAVPPFAAMNTPAIGVSLLQAAAQRAGFTARTRYFALDYAAAIGHDLYFVLLGGQGKDRVASAPPTEALLGEWIFSGLVFDRTPEDDRRYISRFLRKSQDARALLPKILRAREQAAGAVQAWADEIRAIGPKVVGFTTVFHQTCAGLAVARRLKAEPGAPVVVFGGANCAGEMGLELLGSFSWIDYVCTGEGDEVFPAFLTRLLREGAQGSIPGMIWRGDAGAPAKPAMIREMDQLPIPAYDDYFTELRAAPASLRRRIRPRLLIETSRGCWWGEKHHCTFCGLNTDSMTFRAKSPDRVLEELAFLRRRHRVRDVDCVDNILSMRYLQTLFPRLAARGDRLDLFYEVKANLRYDQLTVLRDGGITAIQAGIESFSDVVLGIMRKGCTALQNIQLLRWSAELGIDVIWSILYGFPGEPREEYARMARLLPLLSHLRKPSFAVPVRLDRYSPHFQTPDRFGLVRIRPNPAYAEVFPLPPEAVARLAYFFEFDYADGQDPRSYTRALRRAVRGWEEAATVPGRSRPRLDLYATGSVAMIEDTRGCAVAPVHLLQGLEREVYLACDAAHGPAHLAEALGAEEPAVRRALRRMTRAKLMIERDGRFVSLAVFRARVRPRSSASAAARSA